LWADSGYLGDLETWVLNRFQYQLETAIQPKGKGFQVFAKRWIVQTAFAWFAWYRRLSWILNVNLCIPIT
jgi:transposase